MMSKKKPAPRSEKALRFVGNPEALKPILKQLGGSQADDWNNILTNQALNSLWLAHASDETQIASIAQQRQRSLASARETRSRG